MNSVGSNSLSLKYHRSKPSGCKDIKIIKNEFGAKSMFLMDKTALFYFLYRNRLRMPVQYLTADSFILYL